MADRRPRFIKDARHFGEEDQSLRVARYGAGCRHLIGIYVVILAIGAKRNAGDDGNTASRPDRFQPGRVHRTDVADKAEIRATFTFASAKYRAIAAGQTDRVHAGVAESCDQPFVHEPGEDHQSYVTGFRI